MKSHGKIGRDSELDRNKKWLWREQDAVHIKNKKKKLHAVCPGDAEGNAGPSPRGGGRHTLGEDCSGIWFYLNSRGR